MAMVAYGGGPQQHIIITTPHNETVGAWSRRRRRHRDLCVSKRRFEEVVLASAEGI